jgi:hypothetical protein
MTGLGARNIRATVRAQLCVSAGLSTSDRRSRRRAAIGVVSLASLVALSLMPMTASAAAGWVIQPTPAGTPDGNLYGVSCTSASACTAVGAFISGPYSRPLAESWNGAAWSIQPTSLPKGALNTELYGVSCPTVDACIAVGQYGTKTGGAPLVEAWNGRSWNLQVAPNPAGAQGSVFGAVSCSSAASCTAVGYSYYASGSAEPSLAESWNGTAWSIQSTANPTPNSYLSAVSCSSPSVCLAIGNYDTGAGGSMPLAETWDGSHWALGSIPSPAGVRRTYLDGLSCSSPSTCTAVGMYYKSSTVLAPLAETWDGSRWTIGVTPNPSATYGSGLERVSCPSVTACTATGLSYINSTGDSVSLVETWNGRTWAVRRTPNPAGATGGTILFGISCTSITTCTAVGDFYRGGSGATLVERHS